MSKEELQKEYDNLNKIINDLASSRMHHILREIPSGYKEAVLDIDLRYEHRNLSHKFSISMDIDRIADCSIPLIEVYKTKIKHAIDEDK